MHPGLDPLRATEALAFSFTSREAQRDVWRGAASVRRKFAQEARDLREQAFHLELAGKYEERERQT